MVLMTYFFWLVCALFYACFECCYTYIHFKVSALIWAYFGLVCNWFVIDFLPFGTCRFWLVLSANFFDCFWVQTACFFCKCLFFNTLQFCKLTPVIRLPFLGLFYSWFTNDLQMIFCRLERAVFAVWNVPFFGLFQTILATIN